MKTLSRIVQAAYLKSPTDGQSRSAWRLHTHFEIERGLPSRIDVTGAGNQGEADERVGFGRATPRAGRSVRQHPRSRHNARPPRVSVRRAPCADDKAQLAIAVAIDNIHTNA